jgi:hypothetical protein
MIEFDQVYRKIVKNNYTYTTVYRYNIKMVLLSLFQDFQNAVQNMHDSRKKKGHLKVVQRNARYTHGRRQKVRTTERASFWSTSSLELVFVKFKKIKI